jgi:type I pantothenate kinase
MGDSKQNKLMSKKDQTLMTPYLQFNRSQWAALRDSVPMTLTEGEITRLKGINEDLSLEEVAEIYLPLSRLLNFYISSNLRRQAVLEQFLGTNTPRIPYVISIAGSVAVGKSTTARVLQALLSRWPEHRRVELITTDGFLHPNEVLKERGLMKKKGFPQSYDMHRLVKFVSDIKSGAPDLTAPVYSHLIYDVITDGDKTVTHPDILILEGLNVLQSGMDYPHDPHHVFVSDFVDFSIYVDAPEELLRNWYINRFLKFREGAFTDPDSYFHNYAKLSKDEAVHIATSLWNEINLLNLKENILPTRERASLILTKSADHSVEEVRLRK